MTLAITLNIILSAIVFVAIVTLCTWAIITSPHDGARCSSHDQHANERATRWHPRARRSSTRHEPLAR
jgi:hypothetical protein